MINYNIKKIRVFTSNNKPSIIRTGFDVQRRLYFYQHHHMIESEYNGKVIRWGNVNMKRKLFSFNEYKYANILSS